MSAIVNIKTRNMEYQSHRRYPENWMGDGWIAVPPELEEQARACCPYCELEIEGDALVDITPVDPPAPEPEPAEPEPGELEILQAENKTLKAQVNALSEQQAFYEDCIAEMAGVVYV